MKHLFLMAISMVYLSNAHGQVDHFEKGNEAYNRKAYSEAIDYYQQLLEQGYSSSELYYNLANAYYETGALPKSILNYERAIKIRPGDKRIANNLEIARQQVSSDILEVRDFIIIRWWKSFSSFLSPLWWMVMQIVLCIASLGSIFYWKYKEESKLRIKGLVSGAIILILFLVSVGAGFQSYNDIHADDEGILMETVELKSGPDERSENLTPLPVGIKVKILDKIEDWYKVQLMNKEEGWLNIEYVVII